MMPADGRPHVIAMPTWMGDCVMATPAIRAIRSACPASSVTLAMHRAFWPLFEGLGLTTIGPLPPTLALAWRERRCMVGTRALLLPNSTGSALRARLAWRGAHLVGWSSLGRRGLLHTAIPCGHRIGSEPTVRHYASLVTSWLGVPCPDLRVKLEVTPADHDAAASLLRRHGHGGSPVVVLNPGASKPSKRWPADRFVAVGRHLAGRGALVCVSGSPSEGSLCSGIAGSIPGAIDLAAAGTGLRGLKGLLASARLLVTNDTGTRHVAAALGCPYICIYGPVDPVVSRLEGVQGTDLVPSDGSCASISIHAVTAAAEAWMSSPSVS